MEQLLEIKDLYVEYQTDDARVFAVNGINLKVGKGETLGLVGETGAGKTTTALSIMRLLPEKVGKIKGGTIKMCIRDRNMTKSEIQRAEKIEKEGYRFLQRDDMDVVKFFEYDKAALIERIKKECAYID